MNQLYARYRRRAPGGAETSARGRRCGCGSPPTDQCCWQEPEKLDSGSPTRTVTSSPADSLPSKPKGKFAQVMSDRFKELSDTIRRMAQAGAEGTPEVKEHAAQQIVTDSLTSKNTKKKTKTTAPTDRETRSSLKAPGKTANPTKQMAPSGNQPAPREDNQTGNKQPGDTVSTPVNAHNAEPLTTHESSSKKEAIRLNINKLTNRALEAEEAGNATLAKRFFKICEGLATRKPTQALAPAPLIPPKTAPTQPWAPSPIAAKDAPPTGETNATPDGVVFNDDAQPTSHNVGFTPFFKKNLLELRSPLPLTIFNKVWQDKAIIHYAQKRSKADETNVDKDRYTGYPYPCEYTQTYAEWSINHQGFHAAPIQVANYPKFAGWLLIHKQHCNNLVTQHGFMTGLRYDINVRKNAFAHQIPMPNGALSINNILVLNDVIAQKIIAHCRKFDEADYTENPYIKGVSRAKWDPVTGTDRAKAGATGPTGKAGSSGGNHSNGKGAANQQRAQSPHNQQGSGLGRYSRSQGYKGNRYDAAYDERGDRGRRKDQRGRNYPFSSTPSRFRAPPEPREKLSEKRPRLDTADPSSAWPTGVTCEMNVEEWAKALSKAYRHTVGDDWSFYTPPNHESALQARRKIKESTSKELLAKQMFGPFTHKEVNQHFNFFRTSPLGAVINGDGSLRPIKNLSFPHGNQQIQSVNSFVDAAEFTTTWDNFNTVAKFIRELKH
ncbi:hypothetical protein PTTG_27870 [Puccinia triticina 1-1 BBBD Race 1]|uniref:Uncharacterized protein n=1 Tax=Puccinia triticina (isolate 1-1 / race 1 (BBBD)) TaxID=630390 RepID=A0A180GGC0_PUCT1|nr:hypothetical protein PTTG_27870 [Puccinia triticina 1-1 BBBD Race 1]